MPTTSGSREVPDSIAGELGDLFAIQHDLETARIYCERVNLEWQDLRTTDWDIVQGLSEAAIIRYARCFESGRRFKLDENWLPAELVDEHKYLRVLRSRHVAHPVNDFERGWVTVHVIESGGPREIQNVGIGVGHVAGFDPPAADNLIRLCDALLSALQPRIDQLRQDVETDVRSRSVDEVYSWPELQPFSPSGKNRPERPTR